MALANQQAIRHRHHKIDTAHALLGLIDEGNGVGANVLRQLVGSLSLVRHETEKRMPLEQATNVRGILPQTTELKHAIESAMDQAIALNHDYVGTEHFLLGFMQHPQCIAAQVLAALGVSPTQVRDEVLKLLRTDRRTVPKKKPAPKELMKILIFGATGANGKLLVQQALEQGHTVTAFARDPSVITAKHDRLSVAKGNILDPASIDAVMAGKDGVLSALGTKVLKKNTIISDGTRNIIAAMKKHGVCRFIVETSIGLGDSRGQWGWLFKWIIQPLLMRNVFADKQVQEQLVMQSGLDWTIVRPSGLTNGPTTGKYKIWTGPMPEDVTYKISRADVADFMLQQLSDKAYLYKTPAISSLRS